MAANIEKFFQDFILNKIREIEDQNEDKTSPEGVGDGTEQFGAEQESSERDKQDTLKCSGSPKKHKKHKKHKSKKKRRYREKEESSSESGPEEDGGTKLQPRKGTPTEADKEQGEEDQNKSRDSEVVSKQREGGQSMSPRRRVELPDIIPKQDSSKKALGEKRGAHHESIQSSHGSPKDPNPPALDSNPTQSAVKAEERQNSDRRENKAEERQNSDRRENKAEKADGGRPAAGSGTSQSTSAEQTAAPKSPRPSDTLVKSPAKKRRKPSPQRKRETKSSKRQKRSLSPSRSHRRGSRSRSPSKNRRSRSRSGGRRSRKSRSPSRGRRRPTYSQRDRWKREPSHSPVLILRKNRSPNRKLCSSSNSPQRISELDKEQLLEIAKANAAAMCAKAGLPIPASLRSTVPPLTLPHGIAMNAAMASMTAATMTAALTNMGLSSLLALPSITNKPPSGSSQPTSAALEEVKRKVAKQANSISIKEFTDKCKMIVDSKGELPVAIPHVSDEEDDGKPFGGSALREQKAISFSINNATVRPAVRSDAGMAKEFPVSSGCQHRKKEGEGLGAYGEWVPVDKASEKAAAASRKALTTVSKATASPSSSSADTATAGESAEAVEQSVTDSDSVFPDPLLQPVDISQAVTDRIKAQRRLAENPYDVNAICMLSRAQEQVDAWAQSNTVPGLFTGSTGATVLTSEELSTSGPQAWLKKDQFLRAAPVSGGVGEFLMRKMGWRTGEGLGRNREGTVEPIIIDFKVDRKGLVAEGEKPQKQTGGLVVTKDLMGKHPVSALIELCNKTRVMQPDFVMVHHSGPDHRKNFLFKVTVNGVDYQPQTASPNKKHAKAMAATVALQALGEVPVDGPGLYTGPVFTAASTGPLFST
ncbi:Protein SON [Dissostichus eleginoides]|uniref:Protein SON n=1 Tax=Dissostichus eleginoides TaxID=100907 RepID=A0AAD9EPL0_DISEL|nr:Protein SON [Dissostichus eleginoides]